LERHNDYRWLAAGIEDQLEPVERSEGLAATAPRLAVAEQQQPVVAVSIAVALSCPKLELTPLTGKNNFLEYHFSLIASTLAKPVCE